MDIGRLGKGPRVTEAQQTPDQESTHFDSEGDGEHVVVLTGEAVVDDDAPPVHENPEYLAKYGERITAGWGSAEHFALLYSVPLRISPRRARGH